MNHVGAEEGCWQRGRLILLLVFRIFEILRKDDAVMYQVVVGLGLPVKYHVRVCPDVKKRIGLARFGPSLLVGKLLDRVFSLVLAKIPQNEPLLPGVVDVAGCGAGGIAGWGRRRQRRGDIV